MNYSLKAVAFYLTVIAAVSCGKPFYYNAEKTERPKNNKVFTYRSKFNATASVLPDTNTVYLNHWNYQGAQRMVQVYEYFRFFPGGQMIYNRGDSITVLNDINNTSKGFAGHYYVKEDELYFQVFVVTYGVHGSMGYGRGKLYSDRFVARGGRPMQFVYTRMDMGFELGKDTTVWVKTPAPALQPVRADW